MNNLIISKKLILFGLFFLLTTIFYNNKVAVASDFYYRSLANSYVDHGNYKKAIRAYNKSIKRHPGRADIIYDRGNTYYLMGDYRKAIKDFNKAINITSDPKIINIILMARGFTYLIKLNDKRGCDDFKKLCTRGFCGYYNKAKRSGLCK